MANSGKTNYPKRTVNCGILRESDESREVIINGWTDSRRDLGGLIFFDIRDRYGLVQVVIEPEEQPELAEKAKNIRSEFVIWAKGNVRKRSNPNPEMPTGMIEILCSDIGIINEAELPPFEIEENIETGEETRLKYRYLDLRRPDIQKNLILRNKLYQIAHNYFYENDFIEIETPVLMKSTPEGARDFLVPSRINKGKFYALPQSPQIYKQLLMLSGFDRYMQVVKCFRDEDLRSDRQPEFTQIDIEMSFVDQDDVIDVTEGFIKQLWKETINVDLKIPFRRMSFEEAMVKYGSDKPDLRFENELTTITDIVKNSEFKVFSGPANSGGEVVALKAKGCSSYSRKQIDGLTEFAKKYGAKGLAWIKKEDGEIKSPIAKFLSDSEIQGITSETGLENGDMLLIAADDRLRSYTIAGALRLEIARQTGILEKVKDTFEFCWVVDFPLFEYDEEEQRYFAMHHPFTCPNDESLEILDSEPGNAKAKAYDVVCNGAELGGGSIRIHDSKIQKKMFDLLGMSEDEANDKFGFLIKALRYGTPPHGGIALGLDRVVMTLAGIDNIRDVIAFPKTTSGLSLMDGSPSEVEINQLHELGVDLLKKGREINN